MSIKTKEPSKRYETKTTSNLSESNPEHRQIKEQMEKLEGGYLGFGLRAGAFEKGLTASDSVYLDDYDASMKQMEMEVKMKEELMIRDSLSKKASHAAKDKPSFAVPLKAKALSKENNTMQVIVTKKRKNGNANEGTEGSDNNSGSSSSSSSSVKKVKGDEDDGIVGCLGSKDANTNGKKHESSSSSAAKSAVSALAMYDSDSGRDDDD